VKANETFEIRVAVQPSGEAFGVKSQGGVLEIVTPQLRIRCLPKDLPEVILVDVTELKVGETIKVGELKAVPGVEFLDSKGQPIASCVEPVAEIAAAEVATPAAGAAAPAAGAAATPAAGAAATPAAGAGAGAAAAGAKAPAAAGAKAPAAGAKPAAPAKK